MLKVLVCPTQSSSVWISSQNPSEKERLSVGCLNAWCMTARPVPMELLLPRKLKTDKKNKAKDDLTGEEMLPNVESGPVPCL
ncbi:hypothetical protein LEMLEM_LOCUS13772 [Lemmus lemmus]